MQILKRKKNDGISWNAANNSNCPDKDKIEWMMETGQIEKEDPKKHIIEYEDNKPEDDLSDLKKLLGK